MAIASRISATAWVSVHRAAPGPARPGIWPSRAMGSPPPSARPPRLITHSPDGQPHRAARHPSHRRLSGETPRFFTRDADEYDEYVFRSDNALQLIIGIYHLFRHFMFCFHSASVPVQR